MKNMAFLHKIITFDNNYSSQRVFLDDRRSSSKSMERGAKPNCELRIDRDGFRTNAQ